MVYKGVTLELIYIYLHSSHRFLELVYIALSNNLYWRVLG